MRNVNQLEPPLGWKSGIMGDLVSKILSGTSVNCEDRPAISGEKRMLRLGSVTSGRFIPEESRPSKAEEAHKLQVPVRAGTVLLARKNTPALVGRAAFVDANHDDLFLPDLIWELSPSDGVDARWLHILMEGSAFRQLVSGIASGSSQSMVGIAREAFTRLPVVVPPEKRQREIVAIVSEWDAALHLARSAYRMSAAASIEIIDRLIFSGRFQQVPIGDLVDPSGSRTGNQTLPVYSCTKYDGLIRADEFFTKSVHSKDLSKYQIVRRGELCYATNHIEEGSIGLMEADGGIVSPMYTVFRAAERRAVPGYLYALLKTERMRREFQRNTSASVDRRGGLRWADFCKISAPAPTVDVQEKISDVWSDVRRELILLESRVEILSQQRNRLIDDLLTGAPWLRRRDAEAA